MSSPKFGAQPRANEPVVGRDGLVTQAWRDYFARLAIAQNSDDLRQLYEALAARVAELADGQSLRIVGRNSVDTAGASVVEIQLVGDESAPGNTEYYGTGPTGRRGFFPVASAIAVDTGELEKSVGTNGVITLGLAEVANSGAGSLQAVTVDGKGRVTGTKAATITGTAQQIDVANGDAAAGLPTLSLAELPNEGGGTLQKTLRDSYGRLAGTSVATTSDLAEGGNLYFTDERADARASAAVSAHVAAPNPHPQYQPALPAGTTGQFWRGDGAWSNQLQGPVVIGEVSWGLGFTASLLHEFQDSDGVPCEAMVRYSGGSTGSFVLGMKARGNRVTAAPALAGDRLMSIRGGGWHSGGAWGPNQATEILLVASENLTATANGTRYIFRATRLGETTPVNVLEMDTLHNLHPGADSTQSCGLASRRWSTVYAATGTINTSDGREKTTVRPFTPAELAAAAELGHGIGVYQWLAMVEAKGETARQHIGMTVQQAIAILESHGLDPFAYGFICYDEWDELPEIRDEEGEITQEHRAAGDRYSFRMDELLAFIARGLAHRLDAVEQRLAAAGL